MGKGHRRERGSVLHCPRVVNAAWSKIQRSAKVGAPGLVNFIIAVAHLACSVHATWNIDFSRSLLKNIIFLLVILLYE